MTTAEPPYIKMIECVIPTLKVKSIIDSVRFYSEVLGFEKEWESLDDNYVIAGIKRDEQSIYLCETEEGSTWAWIWIGLEDASLFDIIKASGVKIQKDPTNFPWAYEMRIEDPDGHVLRLATEPRKDMPIKDQK